MPRERAELLVVCDRLIHQFNLISVFFFLRVCTFSVKAKNIADSTPCFPSNVFPS